MSYQSVLFAYQLSYQCILFFLPSVLQECFVLLAKRLIRMNFILLTKRLPKLYLVCLPSIIPVCYILLTKCLTSVNFTMYPAINTKTDIQYLNFETRLPVSMYFTLIISHFSFVVKVILDRYLN
jgi:uncharacterized protein involved in cysteine biosynthesis